jgi:hypothetical protein
VIKRELVNIEKSDLKINTFLSKTLMERLDKATKETETLYGSDIDIGYRIIKQVLIYENAQEGLNLTHTQDKHFLQVGFVWLNYEIMCVFVRSKYMVKMGICGINWRKKYFLHLTSQ